MQLALLQALAIAAGGLSSLGAVLIVLLLLNSKAGPRTAYAFALGYWGGYATIGLLTVHVGARLFDLNADAGPSPVGSIVMCVIGCLLAVLAIKQWRKPKTDAPSESGPPEFFRKLDGIRPLKALGIGLMIPALNFKNLAIYLPAVAVLAAASLAPLEATIAVLATTVVFCGAMLAPLVIYLLVPRRAASWLASLREWIESNGDLVARVVLPLIACLLLFKGGRGLWALYVAGV